MRHLNASMETYWLDLSSIGKRFTEICGGVFEIVQFAAVECIQRLKRPCAVAHLPTSAYSVLCLSPMRLTRA